MAISVETRTIANAGTNSEAFDSGNATEGTFSLPGTFTGTTIQPQFSNGSTNWTNVGSTIAVSANGTYPIPADVFKAKFGRLVSGSAEAAERTITLGLRK